LATSCSWPSGHGVWWRFSDVAKMARCQLDMARWPSPFWGMVALGRGRIAARRSYCAFTRLAKLKVNLQMDLVMGGVSNSGNFERLFNLHRARGEACSQRGRRRHRIRLTSSSKCNRMGEVRLCGWAGVGMSE
jgi:hypothetical protein